MSVTSTPSVANYDEQSVKVADLRLDLRNPRMPDDVFASEEDAIEYLAEHAALDELVNSITSAGWLDYEPLIVLRGSLEVVEGNRRLAALRLIADPELAETVGVSMPADIHPGAYPTEVKAWLVDSRKAARDYIGFKHINGAYKWDSYAKAKFAAEWLEDDPDVAAVSRRLGDTHRTVERLVNGYRMLQQAERVGFARDKVPGRLSFSHLYTAITRPAVREFLGLEAETGLLPENPVPADKTTNLYQLVVWLYGQDEVPPIIRSQNPDLNRLAQVLENRTATAMLVASPSLDEAYGVVEDRAARFASELFSLAAQAKVVAGLLGEYEGDPSLIDLIESTLRAVRGIHATMTQEVREPTGRDTRAGHE